MKIYHLLPAIILLTLLAGCKQDIKLAAPYKEETVIYGLLNQEDNPHYIRIEKGYLLNGNAYVAAGIPDSIYYPDNLNVQVAVSPAGFSYNLTRVDGNTIGLSKDTGIFANTPNYLYTFSGTLDPSQTYTLQVTNPSSGNVVTAQTTLINGFYVNTPVYGQEINLSNSEPFIITWPAAQNAGVYDLTVRFYYKEYSASNTLLKDTFIDIPALRSYLPGTSNSLSYSFTEDDVVNFLSLNLSHNPNIYREFNILKRMQFMFDAGGTSFASFLSSQQAQITSIASSNALPPYSNINNGLGLFSSRYYVEVDSVGLTPSGLDSLACGNSSSGLRFKNSTGSICN